MAWAACTESAAVALAVGKFGATEGLIVSLDHMGRLAVRLWRATPWILSDAVLSSTDLSAAVLAHFL